MLPAQIMAQELVALEEPMILRRIPGRCRRIASGPPAAAVNVKERLPLARPFNLQRTPTCPLTCDGTPSLVTPVAGPFVWQGRRRQCIGPTSTWRRPRAKLSGGADPSLRPKR